MSGPSLPPSHHRSSCNAWDASLTLVFLKHQLVVLPLLDHSEENCLWYSCIVINLELIFQCPGWNEEVIFHFLACPKRLRRYVLEVLKCSKYCTGYRSSRGASHVHPVERFWLNVRKADVIRCSLPNLCVAVGLPKRGCSKLGTIVFCTACVQLRGSSGTWVFGCLPLVRSYCGFLICADAWAPLLRMQETVEVHAEFIPLVSTTVGGCFINCLGFINLALSVVLTC